MGHSMGGHGALSLYLKNLNSSNPYRSASAFAPIANSTKAPWGEKAFGGYLKGGVEEGKEYDATELLKKEEVKGKDLKIFIDVGLGDQFYQQKQREPSLRFSNLPLFLLLTARFIVKLVLPENFIKARDEAGFSKDQVRINLHENYDHSYWFISTFGPSEFRFLIIAQRSSRTR